MAQPVTTVRAPLLHYQERVLPNGLRVFSAQDLTTPNVTVQLWYGVGSRDDPNGRSGFAHLFEHLMFKTSAGMPAEYLDRLTEDVGGTANAETTADYTSYYAVVPAPHIERLLWAEAQRMRALTIDQDSLSIEREVVKEEYRTAYNADPYGRFELATQAASYTVHPYKFNTIGSLRDLDQASLSEVKSFHDAFYRPDNATLIVIGNFPPEMLDAWTDKYFGPIARPHTSLSRVTVVEPLRKRSSSTSEYAPPGLPPAVGMTWQICAAWDPDMPALEVLASVLGSGNTSRLHRDLVDRRSIARNVTAETLRNEQPGLLVLESEMAEGHMLFEGERALLAEVAALRNREITAVELVRAKNHLILSRLVEGASLEGRGSQFGTAIMVYHDPSQVNRVEAEIRTVSAADVQRVAKKYLRENRRVTFRYLTNQRRQKVLPGRDLPVVVAATHVAVSSESLVAAAPPRDLPAISAQSGVAGRRSPLSIEERTLPNGLHVVVARNTKVPIVTLALVFKNGFAADGPKSRGLQRLTNDVIGQGTIGRNGESFASALDSLGGKLSITTNADSSVFSVTLSADQLRCAVVLLAKAVLAPVFLARDIREHHDRSLDNLPQSLRDIGDTDEVAKHVAIRLLYADSADGRVETAASIRQITRRTILRQYGRTYRPDNAALLITGDVDAETGFRLAQLNLGRWIRPSARLAAPVSSKTVATGARIVAVDLPGSSGATIVISAPGAARDDPQFHEAEVADAVLGNGFSARLNQEIRIKRGLSYDAYSYLDARRGSGVNLAVAQTANTSALETVPLMMAVIEKLGKIAAGADELNTRKESLIGARVIDEADPEALSGIIADHIVYGLPLADIDGYAKAIRAVDAQQVRRAASDVRRTVTVIAGDGRYFLLGLKRQYPSLEVLDAKRPYPEHLPISMHYSQPQRNRWRIR